MSDTIGRVRGYVEPNRRTECLSSIWIKRFGARAGDVSEYIERGSVNFDPFTENRMNGLDA